MQQNPWAWRRATDDEASARLELKLDIVAQNQAMAARAIEAMEARLTRLEERAAESGQLTKGDVKDALVQAIDQTMKLRNILVVIGVPTGIIGLIQLAMFLMGG